MSTTVGMRPGSAEPRRNIAATVSAIVLCWLAAAGLSAIAHFLIDPHSPSTGAAAGILSIVGMAWVYTRFVARSTTGSHALGVGMAWLILASVTEIVITMTVHHGWYSLIGSPIHPLLRNIYLLVWVFAPALFADREGW